MPPETPSANKAPLDPSWMAHLAPEFERPSMQQLRAFLQERQRAGAVIYPRGSEYFTAFNTTAFESVKVVILGQDPYHGPGQAHGLCFSVKPGVPVPPSLRNIYKEIETDLGLAPPAHGYLMPWAEQGVFMLNSVLTVEQAQAGSHAKRGWEAFTDAAIRALSEQREHLVFLLWGAYAQKKGQWIDRQRHCVLESVHPSPLSASRGFFGCAHFSKANAYLESRGIAPIDWSLPARANLD